MVFFEFSYLVNSGIECVISAITTTLDFPVLRKLFAFVEENEIKIRTIIGETSFFLKKKDFYFFNVKIRQLHNNKNAKIKI